MSLTDSAIWAADCFFCSDLANPLNCTFPLNVSTLIFAKLTPLLISWVSTFVVMINIVKVLTRAFAHRRPTASRERRDQQRDCA
jgi:hypothetical protein